MLSMFRAVLVILFFLIPFRIQADNQLRQDIEVRIDPANSTMEARARLYYGKTADLGSKTLRLAEQADMLSVEIDGQPTPFDFKNGQLKLKDTSGTELEINYRIRFDDPVPEKFVGIEDPSYGIVATITPGGSFLSRSAVWHPAAVGEESLYRVTIIGPPGLVGVTGGKFLAHETGAKESRTTWETASPRASLTLAANRFLIERDRIGEVDLLTFLLPGNKNLAGPYLESCRRYLEIYQDLLGPYPYPTFAVAENFYPTGYGLPGWTLLGSRVIRLPFIRHTSLPHEITHAWWGNAVEVDYDSGNWAEGLATYLADYYLKELESATAAEEYRRKILRDYTTLIAAGNDQPLTTFRSRRSKPDQALGYGKAAMVFHMLRRRVGDLAFWNGLKAAAIEGRGRRYGWSDLQRHFEASSGTDLSIFFRQWVERSGAPVLRLHEATLGKVDATWTISASVVQENAIYDLLVPYRVTTEKKKIDRQFKLENREHDLTIASSEHPAILSVDPDAHVFRRLFPEELPATVNHLRAAKKPLVVVTENSQALYEASEDLFRGLQWRQAETIREKDFDPEMASGREVLVIGIPATASLQPELPEGFNLNDRQFEVEGKVFEKENDVLFMVTNSIENSSTAYYVGNSAAAIRDAARRIPHYGRYSYLVFRDGQNLIKATWEPSESPLKKVFNEDDES